MARTRAGMAMTAAARQTDMGQGAGWAGPEADAAGLLATFGALRSEVGQSAALRMQDWAPRISRPGFAASARNMAEWLALRQIDLTPLQQPLSALGLSSLGRLEGHVDASLTAVMAALARIAGQPGPEFPGPERFAEASGVLDARRDALFGAQEPGAPQTRIMVTLPTEAGSDGGALTGALIEAGVDCFRINCAHDGPAVWRSGGRWWAISGRLRRGWGGACRCRWIWAGRSSG